jgi:hypothetical protein
MTQTFAPALFDHGSVGIGTSTIQIRKGLYHRITCTGATRTIADPVLSATSTVSGQLVDVADPVRAGSEDVEIGTVLFLEVRATGGALTVTFGSSFKMPTGAGSIASGQRRVYATVWDGAAWVGVGTPADVAN